MCDVFEMHKDPKVLIQIKPHKCVIAAGRAGAQKLVIPVIGKVAFASVDDGVPPKAFEIKDHGVEDTVFFIKMNAHNNEKDPGFAPCDHVGYTPDEDSATLTVIWKPLQSLSKAKRALPKTLRMPLLVNSKLVEEDAVLQLLQATSKAEKKNKAPTVTIGGPDSKKAKTT